MQVTNKRQMYRMLADGDFGNTIPQYFNVDEWLNSADSKKYAWWGVRTLRPAGPCKLNCRSVDVAENASEFGEPVNISMMIDKVTRINLWAEVLETETGLAVYGIENPDTRTKSWRSAMPSEGRQWHGLAARGVLSRHLTPSSVADLRALLDRFPGHVVELSACVSCIGTIPGRNAVIWEVRKY